MDIWHNTTIHISSVIIHDLTVDMHKFLPFPYHMLWYKYYAHVERLYFICFISVIFFFTKHSVLNILDLILEIFKIPITP